MKTLPIPTLLIVGMYTISIRERKFEWASERDIFGRFDPVSLSIDIANENLDETLILDTLIHEIMHAIFFVYGIQVDNEEGVVRPMATAWATVMVDNPDIDKYLSTMVKRIRSRQVNKKTKP